MYLPYQDPNYDSDSCEEEEEELDEDGNKKAAEPVELKKKGEEEANAREGALHAFECLSEALERLFEPYIITILPLLLVCV